MTTPRDSPARFSAAAASASAIARALAAKPSCCSATRSSPPSTFGQAAILNLLEDIQRRTHLTLLFITHDLAVVRWFAGRVVVLYRGQVCEIAPARRVVCAATSSQHRASYRSPCRNWRVDGADGEASRRKHAGVTGCASPAPARAIADRCRTVSRLACDRPHHAIRCHLGSRRLAAICPTPSELP